MPECAHAFKRGMWLQSDFTTFKPMFKWSDSDSTTSTDQLSWRFFWFHSTFEAMPLKELSLSIRKGVRYHFQNQKTLLLHVPWNTLKVIMNKWTTWGTTVTSPQPGCSSKIERIIREAKRPTAAINKTQEYLVSTRHARYGRIIF